MKVISRDGMKAAPGAGRGLKPLMTAVMCIIVATMSLLCSSCGSGNRSVQLELLHLDFDPPMIDFAIVTGLGCDYSKGEGTMTVHFDDPQVVKSMNAQDKKTAKKACWAIANALRPPCVGKGFCRGRL